MSPEDLGLADLDSISKSPAGSFAKRPSTVVFATQHDGARSVTTSMYPSVRLIWKWSHPVSYFVRVQGKMGMELTQFYQSGYIRDPTHTHPRLLT